MKLSGGKNSTSLIVVALVLAILFAIYFYVLSPKLQEVESLESTVATVQGEIPSLEEQIAFNQAEQSTGGNEFTLRKKVPTNREIASLLLAVEEIEFVTGSRVQNISFNNYDSLVSTSNLTDPNTVVEEEITETTEVTEETTEDTTTNTTTTETTETSEEAVTPVSTIAVETLPENLKLVTFNISVESPNYDELQNFMREIERLERVMHIDTISYSLPGEADEFTEEQSDIVTATIQVTTFYYE